MGYRCKRQRSWIRTAVSVQVRAIPSAFGLLSCVQRELHAGVRPMTSTAKRPRRLSWAAKLEYATDERALRRNVSPLRRSRRDAAYQSRRFRVIDYRRVPIADAWIASARLWRLRETARIRRRKYRRCRDRRKRGRERVRENETTGACPNLYRPAVIFCPQCAAVVRQPIFLSVVSHASYGTRVIWNAIVRVKVREI